MLWTLPSDLESGTLPGPAGEEARSDGSLDGFAAVATGWTMAGVSGPDQEPTGAAVREEPRHVRDDHAGASGLGDGVGATDCSGGRGTAHRCDGRRSRTAHSADGRCGRALPLRDCAGRRVGAVRA